MTSHEIALEQIQGRLIKLEKENRALKKIGAAVSIVVTALVLMGQASPKKIIEANEFILKDSGGLVRGRLSVDDKHGALFALSGKDGMVDLFLSSNSSGGGGSAVISEGDEALVLVPSSVGFWHAEGEGAKSVKAEFSSSALFVTDEKGFKATLGAESLVSPSTGKTHKTSAASILLFGKDKNVIWKAP